jgi:hypothetical protein
MKDTTKNFLAIVAGCALAEGIAAGINTYLQKKHMKEQLEQTKEDYLKKQEEGIDKAEKEIYDVLDRMDETIKEGNKHIKESREKLEQHKKSNKES